MEILSDSKYQLIQYDTETRIIGNVWKLETEKSTADEFKAEIAKFGEFIAKKKPVGILGNTLNLRFPITPDVQNWIVSDFYSVIIKTGTRKFAVLVSTDLLTGLSVEQTVEENKEEELMMKYFDDSEKAKLWIKQ